MEERDFKGIWIPKSVWIDERLNALEKVILMEIDSLDSGDKGCFASNKYLADFCQCSETKVSNAVAKLIEYGYIELKSFDGRLRILKSSLTFFVRQDDKNCKADSQNLRHINNNTLYENNNNTYYTNKYTPALEKTDEKPKETKHKYGEYNNVLLKDSELNKLYEDYTEDTTKKAIEYLSDYIEMKGAKYKSHYLAMRKWVFDALKEKKFKSNTNTKTSNNSAVIHQREYTKEQLDNVFSNIDDFI